jgi:hypothetical protein
MMELHTFQFASLRPGFSVRAHLKKKAANWKSTAIWILLIVFWVFTSCSASKSVVGNTSDAVTRTAKNITRTIIQSDDDLKRIVGLFDFENRALRESYDFQNIFHKGLPAYIDDNCPNIIVAARDTGGLVAQLQEPPRLESGMIDNFSLAIIGRQLGLNAIVAGGLEDIRLTDELKGILWTKDTHHFMQVFIRVEVYDTRTATKILDGTFDRRIEIDDLEYRMIREREEIKVPELNETLKLLLTDIGDDICNAVRDQPWTGYITKVEDGEYIISSGIQVGLENGDILEVFDSSRVIDGVGGQRFFTPGSKIGEVEIVDITGKQAKTRLVSGQGIVVGSTVRRK